MPAAGFRVALELLSPSNAPLLPLVEAAFSYLLWLSSSSFSTSLSSESAEVPELVKVS